MLLTGPIDLSSMTLTVTGDPLFDLFFSMMIYLGIIALGLNVIFSFFDF